MLFSFCDRPVKANSAMPLYPQTRQIKGCSCDEVVPYPQYQDGTRLALLIRKILRLTDRGGHR
jgi:hypothetical protein